MQANPPLFQRGAVAAALIALLLSACGPAVKREPARVSEPVAAPVAAVPEARRTSAEDYLAMARRAQPPKRQEYQLRAAGAMVAEGRVEEARRLAGLIQSAPLGEELRLRKRLVLALIALARGDAEAVLKHLPAADSGLSNELRGEITETRARAYQQRGNALEAARERLELEPLLSDPAAQARNRQAVFDTLSTLSVAALEAFVLAPPDPLSGWLELVAGHKRAGGDRDALELELERWRLRYPGHPGNALVGGGAVPEGTPPALEYPDTIAVLLPLSGRLAAAGESVRDGLLAAYYRERSAGSGGGAAPELRIYDTAGDAAGIWGVYRQALADGAKAIVGPLDKGAVSALALAGELDVPLLALNHVDELTRGGFHQFSLSPEDEARSVAMRAWLDGHRRALLLTPQGEWGERVAAAFAEHWGRFGNEVVERAAYDPAEADFSQPIQALLDLDQSELRYRALRTAVKRKLEFEPRRREDVDLILLASAPREARLIRPQLRFHQAGDIALYATSHVFAGRIDPDADRDMDGLVFCDMPWSLPESRGEARAELEALWPEGMSRYARLYAMGMDAYRLVPHLTDRARAASLPLFQGATGNLTLEAGNRVHRELRCARFIDGVPVSLAPPIEETPPEEEEPTIMEERADAPAVSMEEARLVDAPAERRGGGAPGAGAPARAGTEAPRP